MSDRQQREQLFVTHLELIERILAALARRQGLRDSDAEDFASWIKLRLVEDEYRALAQFRGESSLATYLTVVLAMHARDYRVQEHGRWRPSAAALHAGPLAVRLERLLYRDGYTLDAAAELLRAAGETALTTRQLTDLVRRLPRRDPLRPGRVDPAVLELAMSADDADVQLGADEADIDHARADAALRRALARLPDEERVMMRMRFWEGSSVADIARALGTPQKPLYRRLDRALVVLRAELEAAGVGGETARAYLARDTHAPPAELDV